MNYFDILLAKKMGGSTPLPANAYLLEEVTDGDLTSAKSKPLPSVSVAVTDADELDVFVGDSETIVSDNEPYLYRQSKGGRMVSERLVGASVAWNQLASVRSQSVSLVAGSYKIIDIANGIIENHKYILDLKATISENGVIRVRYPSISSDTSLTANVITPYERIVSGSSSSNKMSIQFLSQEENATGQVDDTMLFDLTLMFGSTVADYVYSLEQTTAGSGIAWLKSYGFFSEDYYAYDSGSLKSVSVSEKKVRDASDNVIATYPLPSSDLRGLYKLANNKLYCDGDIQYGDGWRLRRYGIVDLGTLSWIYMSGSQAFRCTASPAKTANIICPHYTTNDPYATWEQMADRTIQASTADLVVKDARYTDAATFKTAMSGAYLIYELATPVWEKTHPFTNPQTVGSTEEFAANLPVGHESKYYDGDIHHSYIYSGDARAKVTGDVDIVNGTAPNATCSVCVVMPDGDEIWSDAGDVTAEIWT